MLNAKKKNQNADNSHGLPGTVFDVGHDSVAFKNAHKTQGATKFGLLSFFLIKMNFPLHSCSSCLSLELDVNALKGVPLCTETHAYLMKKRKFKAPVKVLGTINRRQDPNAKWFCFPGSLFMVAFAPTFSLFPLLFLSPHVASFFF